MDFSSLLVFLAGFTILAATYAVFALGLNVHWGATGLLNFGIAGFFALGAYTSALLTTASPEAARFEDFLFGGNLPAFLGPLNLGVDLWFFLALGGAAFVSAAVALGIGFLTLRLREDYLAIATLGIAEVTRLVFLNEDWLANGSRGLYRIPRFLEGWVSAQHYDFLYAGVALAILSGIFLLLRQALNSPWGRVLRAIREDELTAAASGKNVFWFKLQAFILGAAVMGVGGALYAHGVRFINPLTFDPLIATFIIWVMLMVGGSGNNIGAVVGAFVVWGIWSGTQALPELLPGSNPILDFANSPNLRLFIIGVLLVLILLLRPSGILGERRRITQTDRQEKTADTS